MLKCQTCLRGDFTAVTNKVACVVRTVCIALRVASNTHSATVYEECTAIIVKIAVYNCSFTYQLIYFGLSVLLHASVCKQMSDQNYMEVMYVRERAAVAVYLS